MRVITWMLEDKTKIWNWVVMLWNKSAIRNCFHLIQLRMHFHNAFTAHQSFFSCVCDNCFCFETRKLCLQQLIDFFLRTLLLLM